MQRKSLLSYIGVIDPSDSSLITFDLDNHVRRLPHQIAFPIKFLSKERKSIGQLLMKVPLPASFLFLVGNPLALLLLTSIRTPWKPLMAEDHILMVFS